MCIKIGILVIVVFMTVMLHPHHLARRGFCATTAMLLTALAFTEEADERKKRSSSGSRTELTNARMALRAKEPRKVAALYNN